MKKDETDRRCGAEIPTARVTTSGPTAGFHRSRLRSSQAVSGFRSGQPSKPRDEEGPPRRALSSVQR